MFIYMVIYLEWAFGVPNETVSQCVSIGWQFYSWIPVGCGDSWQAQHSCEASTNVTCHSSMMGGMSCAKLSVSDYKHGLIHQN
jgi:hypothetical protein